MGHEVKCHLGGPLRHLATWLSLIDKSLFMYMEELSVKLSRVSIS